MISACTYIAIRYRRIQLRRAMKQQDASRRMTQISERLVDSLLGRHGLRVSPASSRRITTVNPLMRGSNPSQRVAPEPFAIQSQSSQLGFTEAAADGPPLSPRGSMLLSSLVHARVRQHPQGRAYTRAAAQQASQLSLQPPHNRTTVATTSPLFANVVAGLLSSPRAVHASSFDVAQSSPNRRQGACSVIVKESITRPIEPNRRSVQAAPSSLASVDYGTPLVAHTQPVLRVPASPSNASSSTDPLGTPGTGSSFTPVRAVRRSSLSSSSLRGRRRSEVLHSDRAYVLNFVAAVRSPNVNAHQAGLPHNAVEAYSLTSGSSIVHSHHSHEAPAVDNADHANLNMGRSTGMLARAMTVSSDGHVRVGQQDISSTVAFNIHAIEHRTASRPHRHSIVASSPAPALPTSINLATSRDLSQLARRLPIHAAAAPKTVVNAGPASHARASVHPEHIKSESSVVAFGAT